MKQQWKKTVMALASAALVMNMVLPARAAETPYKDTQSHWAEASINRWSDNKILQGSGGNYNPDGQLTRGQMAVIIDRLLRLPKAVSSGLSDTSGLWCEEAIDRCFAANIMKGSDGKAMPNAPISRQQTIVILCRALGIEPVEDADNCLAGYADLGTVSGYAKGYVAAMVQNGMLKGTSDTTLSPQSNITRAAIASVLDRGIGVYANEPGIIVDASQASGLILIAADNVVVENLPKESTVLVSKQASNAVVDGVSVEAGAVYTQESVADDKTTPMAGIDAPKPANKPSKPSHSSGSDKSDKDDRPSKPSKPDNTKPENSGKPEGTKPEEKPDGTKPENPGKPDNGGGAEVHTHTWSEWEDSLTDNAHVRHCLDTSCDAKESKPHTFGTIVSVDANTHKSVCTVCGKESVENHHWKMDENNKVVYVEVDGAKHAAVCEDCGYQHEWTHSATSYAHDDAKHWKICTDCAAVFDEASHEFGLPKSGTNPETGEICGVSTCKVCNLTKYEKLSDQIAFPGFGQRVVKEDAPIIELENNGINSYDMVFKVTEKDTGKEIATSGTIVPGTSFDFNFYDYFKGVTGTYNIHVAISSFKDNAAGSSMGFDAEIIVKGAVQNKENAQVENNIPDKMDVTIEN